MNIRLNISKNATYQEIKMAFHTAARKYHPDRRQRKQQCLNNNCRERDEKRNQRSHQNDSYLGERGNCSFDTCTQQEKEEEIDHPSNELQYAIQYTNENNDNNEVLLLVQQGVGTVTDDDHQYNYIQIQVAWECLRDIDRRKQYDVQLQIQQLGQELVVT